MLLKKIVSMIMSSGISKTVDSCAFMIPAVLELSRGLEMTR